jgi:dTMP kinase
MAARGKFIVLEGIDGSGKRTQMELLARALASRNVEFTRVSFPRYDGFFGKMVAQFLNGAFGSLETVDPHFSALLYAGDRLESKPEIEGALASGRMVLADRYVGSNLAHQGARVPRAQRAAFLKWLQRLEYGIYGLPKEDLVVYLRVPPQQAQRLVGQKAARTYTNRRRDLQETNLVHLRAASAVYDELARQPKWLKIDCTDVARAKKAKTGGSRSADQDRPPFPRRAESRPLRAPGAIHQEILAAIGERILPALRA